MKNTNSKQQGKLKSSLSAHQLVVDRSQPLVKFFCHLRGVIDPALVHPRWNQPAGHGLATALAALASGLAVLSYWPRTA